MQTKRKPDIITLFPLVFWVLFVLGGYYYFHKPINLEMIAAPFSALLDVLFVFLFAGLAGGIGRKLLPAKALPPLERAAVHFALGAGVLSLLWLLFGVMGLYRFPIAAPLLLLGLILLWRDARAWYGEFGALKTAWDTAPGLEKLLAVLAGALVIYQLLLALAPPVKWDALAYHLQLPRQYLAAGRLVFVPENPYWGHPQFVEMLYTFAMNFHRAETAAVLGWGAGVIFLLGLLGFSNTQLAKLRGNPENQSSAAGWVAVIAVLAGYTFRYLLAWAYTDLFSALFGLSALIAFFAWLDTRRSGWFLWAGLFCGLALGTKWTPGVLGLGIFTAALIFSKQGGLTFKTWLLAGMIALLAVLPWLAKNWIVTGNPLYPYLGGTTWVDAARLASANPPPERIDWWLHLLLPISTTWTGVDSAPGFSADLGPLLLLLAVPGLWIYRRCERVQTLAILLIYAGLGIGVASLRLGHLMQTRLYYALLPCLALPAGWGWDWLQRQVIQGVRLRRILGAVLLLVMSLIAWQDSYFLAQVSPARLLMGTQTVQAYLENTMGFHIRAAQALAALPQSEKILLLWEPRGLYMPLNAQADLWIDRWRTDRRELQTAPAILKRWQAEGFTHLMIYQPGVELIRPQPGQASSADWTVLQELLGMLSKPESIGDTYYLYDIHPRPAK